MVSSALRAADCVGRAAMVGVDAGGSAVFVVVADGAAVGAVVLVADGATVGAVVLVADGTSVLVGAAVGRVSLVGVLAFAGAVVGAAGVFGAQALARMKIVISVMNRNMCPQLGLATTITRCVLLV